MTTKRNDRGQFVTDESKPTYDGMGIFYDHKGYPKVYKDGKNKMVHVLEWEKHNGPKPEGMEIHHKDEDKSNWDIDNLELLSNSDHQRIHAGWIRNKDGEWIKKPCKDCEQVLPLENFYEREGLTPTHICKECIAKRDKKRQQDEEYREKRKKYMKEYYRNNKEKWGVSHASS